MNEYNRNKIKYTLNKNQRLLQKDNPSKLYLNYRALNEQI